MESENNSPSEEAIDETAATVVEDNSPNMLEGVLNNRLSPLTIQSLLQIKQREI